MGDDETTADPLAAYHLEISGIEDGWFAKLEASIEPRRYYRPIVSPWRRGRWDGLREIQERHGIAWPDDPRVFSIASFRHEIGGIEARWERSRWERQKAIMADPDREDWPAPSYPYPRHEFDVANCVARHFPRFDPDAPPSPFAPMDSLPKAWLCITKTIGLASILSDSPRSSVPGMDHMAWLDGKAKECTEAVHSLLLRLRVPWTPDPIGFPRDLSEKQRRDHLQSIANRIEREEAESLSPGLHRLFAVGPPAQVGPAGSAPDPGPRADRGRPADVEGPTPPGSAGITHLIHALDGVAGYLHFECGYGDQCAHRPAREREKGLPPLIRQLDASLRAVTPADFGVLDRPWAEGALGEARRWLDGRLDAWDWRGVVGTQGESYLASREADHRKAYEQPLLKAALSWAMRRPRGVHPEGRDGRIIHWGEMALAAKLEPAEPAASSDEVYRLNAAFEEAPMYGRDTPRCRTEDWQELRRLAEEFRKMSRGVGRPETISPVPPNPDADDNIVTVFLRYMEHRDWATFEELATHVHECPDVVDSTIRSNVSRVNRHLESEKAPFKFSSKRRERRVIKKDRPGYKP